MLNRNCQVGKISLYSALEWPKLNDFDLFFYVWLHNPLMLFVYRVFCVCMCVCMCHKYTSKE